MIPILFDDKEEEFKSQGLGALTGALSCTVRESLNGEYELEMQYPVDGLHFDEIADRQFVFAIPSPYRLPQPFRIYRITKPIGGVATVYARHKSYDLSGTPVSPFNASNVVEALNGLKANTAVSSVFDFWTDKTTQANFAVTVPSSTRALLGGQAGSILDVYGGEYEFDYNTVKLYNKRGQDNGVSIRYGKNMTDLEQDRNISNVATGVYPYWTDTDGNVVVCDQKIINVDGDFGFTKIITVDFSQDFEEAPTSQQLEERTRRYIKENNIGVPSVSISVNFAQLEQTDEYKDFALVEKCDLGDNVTVEFERLGVDATARIVEIETDALNEKYISLQVGSVRSTITEAINQQQQEIAKAPTTSTITQIANAITAAIIGAKGGCVRLLDTDGDGVPDTLYIADNADPVKAKKVWRFNYEGWGGSKNGYNGPFTIAASLENGMYADFLTAGTLNAAQVNVINLKADSITAGTLNCALLKVVNLVAKGVQLTGNFRTESDRFFADLWAGVFKMGQNNGTTDNEFIGLSTSSSDANNGNGVINVWEVKNGTGEVKTKIIGGTVTTELLSVGSGGNMFTAAKNGVYARFDDGGINIGKYGINLNNVYAEKLNIGGVERTFLTII